jgi:hypothetical protein
MNLTSKIMLYLAVCSLFAACSAPRVVQDYQRDSVRIIVKDSTIFKDSVVLVEIPTERERLVAAATDTSHLETSVAWSEAFVADGKLYHTLQNKDALLPVKITIPKKVHTEQREKAMIYKQTEIVEVEKELSKWQNFIQMLGYGVLIACVLWILNKMRKFVA